MSRAKNNYHSKYASVHESKRNIKGNPENLEDFPNDNTFP